MRNTQCSDWYHSPHPSVVHVHLNTDLTAASLLHEAATSLHVTAKHQPRSLPAPPYEGPARRSAAWPPAWRTSAHRLLIRRAYFHFPRLQSIPLPPLRLSSTKIRQSTHPTLTAPSVSPPETHRNPAKPPTTTTANRNHAHQSPHPDRQGDRARHRGRLQGTRIPSYHHIKARSRY